MKYLLLLLFSFNVFAQQKVITKDIKIDAINPTSTLSASGTYTSNWVTVKDFTALNFPRKRI